MYGSVVFDVDGGLHDDLKLSFAFGTRYFHILLVQNRTKSSYRIGNISAAFPLVILQSINPAARETAYLWMEKYVE